MKNNVSNNGTQKCLEWCTGKTLSGALCHYIKERQKWQNLCFLEFTATTFALNWKCSLTEHFLLFFSCSSLCEPWSSFTKLFLTILTFSIMNRTSSSRTYWFMTHLESNDENTNNKEQKVDDDGGTPVRLRQHHFILDFTLLSSEIVTEWCLTLEVLSCGNGKQFNYMQIYLWSHSGHMLLGRSQVADAQPTVTDVQFFPCLYL